MNERIKKFSKSLALIVAIAAILYLPVLLTTGVIALPKFSVSFNPLKSTLASVSVVFKNFAPSPGAENPETENDEAANSNSPIASSTASSSVSSVQKKSSASSTVPAAVSSNSSGAKKNATSSASNSQSVQVTRGAPDLEIKIVDKGILDDDNKFIHADSVKLGQKVAVVFDIKNVGTRVTSEWDFVADTPSPNGKYTSPIQSPLVPGEYDRFTMGFNNLSSNATNTLTITVDPELRVASDTIRTNNVATTTFFRDY